MPDRTRAYAILDRVRSIPEGFVASYRDVCPEAPRFAGNVLAHADDPELPWHRVVRADGSLARGADQRRRLEAEGVPFDGARVAMDDAHVPAEALDQLAADR